MAAIIPASTFPEDIERAITDVLLDDARDMRGTMSLVASRFHVWTKPITFRTAVVRQHKDWTKRISDLLLPNASFIRVLAINLPGTGGKLSEEELSHIQRLLEASDGVNHLAVGWYIWAHFRRECGSLQLRSLYLIWDRAYGILPPSLDNLEHPTQLKDLTVYAPHDLKYMALWRSWGELYIPETARCTNLAYVTYAADRPIHTVGSLYQEIPHIQGVMFVLVDIPGEYPNEEEELAITKLDKKMYPNFSTAYLRFSGYLLAEWVAKMEGGPSVLEHPPPRAVVESDADDRA
ncbi:hypothetical protein DFH09DRAFT_489463 [Mycena vulgaris]|nr:hypothetical protein DFH09DRAFT_489463 [Mycena vulgaris]